MRSRPAARTPVSGSRFGRLFGIHQVAKLFGGLEVRHALGRHLHSLPSLGIAPNPRIPLPYTERPKAANLDLVAGLQRMDHGIEYRLNNDLAIAPRQISETGHFLDQVRLCHMRFTSAPSITGLDSRTDEKDHILLAIIAVYHQ